MVSVPLRALHCRVPFSPFCAFSHRRGYRHVVVFSLTVSAFDWSCCLVLSAFAVSVVAVQGSKFVFSLLISVTLTRCGIARSRHPVQTFDCLTNLFFFIFFVCFIAVSAATPTLSVALAGGEEVLPKTFFCDDGSLKQLVDPAARRLGVDPMRCVLLSPTGNRMAHSATPSSGGARGW